MSDFVFVEPFVDMWLDYEIDHRAGGNYFVGDGGVLARGNYCGER